jgi:hypothetical protein
MRKGRSFSLLFLVAISAIFLYGIIELLIARFEAGNVFPPYSSYRSDPLGSKAFYEGLGLLSQVKTFRNVEPLSRLSWTSGTVLFLFGMDSHSFSAMHKETLRAIEDIAQAGGRIVITFAPTDNKPIPPSVEKTSKENEKENTGAETEKEDTETGIDKAKEEEKGPDGKAFIDLRKRWLIETTYSGNEGKKATLAAVEEGLPVSLPWYSTLFFNLQDNTAWRTIYARANEPVVIERSYTNGSIVLISDSFLISNEAMKHSRYSGLLGWLCGDHQNIVFDETHLGISKDQGIASLIRKYGLVPFFAALIVLALLFIWRQSTSLVPPQEEGKKVAVDADKDSLTGFTNLLRRNISPHEVLTACLGEWKRSFTHGAQNFSALLPRMEEIIDENNALPKRKRDPVKAYRALSKLRAKQ